MEPTETPETERGSRNFLTWFVCGVVFFFFFIPLTNLIVDPFLRFDLITIKGFNEQKPHFSALSRIAKPGVVCRLQPGSIVLGTSRVEVGIDPKHPGWDRSHGPTYNLALTGSGLQEIFVTFQHAVHASPRLREVLIGLDFLMFNAHREAAVFGTEVLNFDLKRLMIADDSCGRSFRYDINWFLGFAGLKSSLFTVARQMPPPDIMKATTLASWLALQTPDGYRGESFRFMEDIGNRYGFRSIFDGGTGNGAPQEVYYASRIWRAGPEGRYCFRHAGGEDTISLLRKIVDFARQSQIDVRFLSILFTRACCWQFRKLGYGCNKKTGNAVLSMCSPMKLRCVE